MTKKNTPEVITTPIPATTEEDLKKFPQLLTLKPKEFGLTEEKAQIVSVAFAPKIKELIDLEPQFITLMSKPISEEVCEEAKALAKVYGKLRNSTDKTRKELKAEYLNGGRFVDGWGKAHASVSNEKEDSLKALADHFDKIEREAKAKLRIERTEALAEFEVFDVPSDLAELSEEMWEAYLMGCESKFNIQKANEKREAELKAKQEADQKAENDRLKAEAEKNRLETERLRKEKDEADKQAEADRKAKEQAEAKLSAGSDENLKAEAEARQKAEAKLKAMQKEKADREAKEKAEAEAESNKGETEKFSDFCEKLKTLPDGYEFTSPEYSDKFKKAQILIKKILDFVED